MAPKHLRGLTQTPPASLPLFCMSVHLKVCLSLQAPGPGPLQSTSQIPSSPEALGPGLAPTSSAASSLGSNWQKICSRSLRMTLASTFSLPLEPEGAGLLPCSLPTWDLSELAWGLEGPALSSRLNLQEVLADPAGRPPWAGRHPPLQRRLRRPSRAGSHPASWQGVYSPLSPTKS